MYDVIILGAGIAGLGAARVLTRESYNAVILEARSRPGGRIHGVRLPPIASMDQPTNSSMPNGNHDSLSIFHSKTNNLVPKTPSINDQLSSNSDSNGSSTIKPTTSPYVPNNNKETPSQIIVDDPMGPIDLDLGANYLIGCSNRQSDQPLFHLARLLDVPTATCVGDLCKKYRGWECAELAVWRDHLQPDAPLIPIEQVAEATFLFDKVVHLSVHKHLKARAKNAKSGSGNPDMKSNEYGSDEPSVKQFIEESLQSILQSESDFGLRPQPAFRSALEEGVYQSIVMRYLTYVNPLERLPHTVLDELCEVATPRWSLNMNNAILRSLGLEHVAVHKLTLADRLALAYPSTEQREAYGVWAERKLEALSTGQSGAAPTVARSVSVSWEDRLVTGRFSDLLRPLLDEVEVVYNAVVTEVHWSSSNPSDSSIPRVRVRVRRGDEEQWYEAKHCIITVPVGVLKGLHPQSRITFHPELPFTKREAIRRLGPPSIGAPTHEKVILRFRVPDDVFWDADAAHLKCPDPRLHILNLHRYGKPGILCAHIWGGSGLCQPDRSDDEIIDILLDILDRMYPNTERKESNPDAKRSIPNPVFALRTHWSDDPFALGAYTTGEPGSSDNDRVLYAVSLTDNDARIAAGDGQPVNSMDAMDESTLQCPVLLFAGEGTLTSDEAKECTHGALQTGVLRALELLPFLSSDNQSDRSSTNNSQSVDNGQLKTLILAKLAQYLMGRPLSRWLQQPTLSRPNRVQRSTRTATVSQFLGLDDLPARTSTNASTNPRRQRHLFDDTDSEGELFDGSPSSSSMRRRPRRRIGRGSSRRVAGRGHSNAARAVQLNRQSLPVRHPLHNHRKRKSENAFLDVSKSTADCPSETSSATTIEARQFSTPSAGKTSCCHSPQRSPTLAFLNASRELMEHWPSMQSEDRTDIISTVSSLLNELQYRHLELKDHGTTNGLMLQSSHSVIPPASTLPY